MKMNKRQCLGLWHAKGWKLEGVEAAVQRRGFSRTSLSDMGQSTEPADSEFVALAWKAKVLGKQEDFEIYWRGLASLGVEVPPELLTKLKNPPPRMDPPEITPKLDTLLSSAVEKLETVLSAVTRKLDSIAASLRGKLDIFALAAEGRLDDASAKLDLTHEKLDSAHEKLNSAHEKLDSTHEKLDVVQATLNGTGAKIGVIDAKLDGNRRELRRLLASGALAAIAAVSSCVASVSQRLTAPGLIEETSRRREPLPAEADGLEVFASGTGQMGEKAPSEKWVPKQPFSWQQLAKDCDPATGEKAINGGCWVPIAGVAPPCGKLFRHGDICYRPVVAPPQKPVGATP